MEEVIGSLQRKKEQEVLLKYMEMMYGTQPNLEKFSINKSKQPLLLLPKRTELKMRELQPIDFLMIMISEKLSTRKLELELEELP
jgi:hypothetical protein